MSELMITLGAVLLVCGAWELYTRHRRGRGLRERMARIDDPAARPPATAVPVDSELVRRLHASRSWPETRALLSEDCVMVLPGGRRVGASALDPSRRAPRGHDPDATVEAVLADLEQPSVLYVDDRAHWSPRRGPAFTTQTWTRVVVSSCGTRIREVGPSSVVVS